MLRLFSLPPTGINGMRNSNEPIDRFDIYQYAHKYTTKRFTEYAKIMKNPAREMLTQTRCMDFDENGKHFGIHVSATNTLSI